MYNHSEKLFFRKESDNFIPVRRWMRGHYTKLTRSDGITCNHCNDKYSIASPSLFLHKHLVEAHPDKLTDEEKKEDKFFWTWDYFTIEDDSDATCKICETTIRYTKTYNLTQHLKTHK